MLSFNLGQDAIDAVERNVFQAAFFNVDNTWPNAEPRCSGANCTWPVFSSLGICATLSNITDQLRIEETTDEFRKDALNASLPLHNGTAYLLESFDKSDDNTQPIMNMTSPEPLDYTAQLNVSTMTQEEVQSAFEEAYKWPPERESLAEWGNSDLLRAAFSQFYFIFANDNVAPDSGDRYRAVELLWHFCVHDYEVTVQDGESRTETVNAETKITKVERSSADGGPNTFWMANAHGNETFPVMERWEYTRLDPDFRRAFSGAHSTRWGTDADYTEFNRQFGLSLYQGTSNNMSVQDVDDKMWDNLGRLSWNIARSMTTL